MKMNNQLKPERARLAVLGIVMFLMLGLLAGRLWRMQVGAERRYDDRLENQSVRRIRIPGIRGGIFDRNGICLAENKPNFGIAIYLEEVRRAGRRGATADEAWRLIQKVSDLIGKDPEITRAQIDSHLYRRRLLPLIAWQNVDERILARLVESGLNMPAVDIMVKPSRSYPQGTTACHIIGYVSAAQSGEDDSGHHHFYLPDMAGRRGLERKYDRQLAGAAGGSLVRIDVSGFKHEEIGRREPEFGRDLMLAVDLRIQHIAERAVAGTAGAVVVLDPLNGDVLAMASAPGFDLGEFSPTLSRETWNRLMSDPRRPLLNRAVSGHYAPGSIFKPVVAIAAIESGKAGVGQTYFCSGFLELGGHRFRCHREIAHGPIGFRQALEVSCNVFFYKLGMQTGYDDIRRTAFEAGMGRKTGIDLEYESSGLLQTREGHYERTGHPWRAGDTCNVSIGQGPLLVTPLQMAALAAAIANGGMIYEPRLVIGRRTAGEEQFAMEPPRLSRVLNWSQENLDAIREGMKAVVHGRRGTGHLASVPGIIMGGKTGTAEYGSKADRRHHGWMIVFAPFDNPRYAAAMVMDDAASGGTCVGPRIGRMMKEIFEMGSGEGSP